MIMLKKGDKAPDFETLTETGDPFSMKSLEIREVNQ